MSVARAAPVSEPTTSAPEPGSPEWQRKITASKVAAILGVSPWDSPRSVWHAMRGELPREEASEVQKRGHYLEPAILAWWRDQHDVSDNAFEWTNQPTFALGDWAAATPDALAHFRDDQRALVEAKSAAYDDDWGDPGTDAIPTYYLVQVWWQMHVSGVHRCYVPVLTSRLRFAEYVVDYDAEIGADLERRMRAFYDSLAADVPPPLDDSVATFQSMRRLHPEIDLELTRELTREQAVDLVGWQYRAKQAEAPLRLAKSAALDVMGNARYATYLGVKVARRQPDGPDRTKFVVVAKPDDLTAAECTEEAS